MKFNIRNFLPSYLGAPTDKRSISRTIARFQLTRLKHDGSMYRDALTEAENAFYPHRVKMQRMYLDTVINGHIEACTQRRNDLVLLKEFAFFKGDKIDSNNIDEQTTDLFKTKWFYEFMRHALDAKYYGYSLIELGDIVDNTFPNLKVVQRELVSPDRLMLGRFTYSINGEAFTDPANEFCDWTVYVPTASDKGSTPCGYGLFYKVALYEIYLRNLLGANANYNDKYGQPVRHAKTSKLEGPEYDELCKAMDEMGENSWIVTDTNDELVFVQAQSGNGAGFKTYENFETRLEKKISKVILRHADALDSTPGKLGGDQGGEKSPVAQALEDLETVDARDFEYVVNNVLVPNLIKIGFPIPVGLKFGFKNDKEKEEIRQKKDASNLATATSVKTFKEAGFKVKKTWLEEHTGMEFDEVEDPDPVEKGFSKDIKNRLDEAYGRL